MVAPLVKWPGGKSRELPAILAALPPSPTRLVDPFVGGGAVLFATPASLPAAVNDASEDLMGLYRCVQSQDRRFVVAAESLARWWDGFADATAAAVGTLVEVFLRDVGCDPAAMRERASDALPRVEPVVGASVPFGWDVLSDRLVTRVRADVPVKLGRMRALERRHREPLPVADVWDNVEGALRAALYTTVRWTYNRGREVGDRSPAQSVRFLFLRELAYAAMFRFNRQGEFNVPYGGITYNRKSLGDRVAHLVSDEVVARLATTTLAHGDFEGFLDAVDLGPGDVVFLDPPYDTDFSTYDGAGFGPNDHRRLAAVIRRLPCAFQLVIKDTPLVRELYVDPCWHVTAFDHTYSWTIKQRNDRSATHLLITNAASPSRAADVVGQSSPPEADGSATVPRGVAPMPIGGGAAPASSPTHSK